MVVQAAVSLVLTPGGSSPWFSDMYSRYSVMFSHHLAKYKKLCFIWKIISITEVLPHSLKYFLSY